MAVIGRVVEISGASDAVKQVMVQTQSGEIKPLHLNDTLQAGDTVIAPPGVVVEVQLTNGRIIEVQADHTVTLSQELVDAVPPSTGDSAVDDATIQAVIQAINEGRDISEVLEETAAGLNAAGLNGGGFDFVNLSRILENVTPLDFQFAGNETERAAIDFGVQNDDVNDVLLNSADAPILSLAATSSLTEAGGNVIYTASLTQAAPSAMSITLSNGSVITIAAGATTGSITVAIPSSDDFYNDPGSISVGINNVSGGDPTVNIDATPAITNITDTVDVTTITLTADAAVAEGGNVTYTATLSNSAQTPVTVTLSGGQTISIAAGANSGSVSVAAPADDPYVDAGTVSKTITAATGGNFESLQINTAPAVTSITDTIDTTTVSITGSTSVAEGASASYTIALNNPTQTPLTVNLTYSGSAINGSGASSDYTGVISVTIPANGNSATFSIPTNDDLTAEGTENFVVTIASTSGGNFENIAISGAAGSVTTTIVDNDGAPTIASVSSSAVNEGNDLIYTINLSNPSSTPMTYPFTIGFGTPAASAADIGTPVFGAGITDNGDGTITVAPNVTAFTITVPTINDTLNEVNEVTTLTVGGVTGSGTINDNDAQPALSINDVTVNEAAGTITFTVSLSAASGQAVSVNYNTTGSSATTPADYAAGANALTGVLTFNPGVVTQTITLNINNDNVFEGTETFNVNLSGATNATITDGLGIGTITDDGTGAGGSDNDTPSLSVIGSSVNEGGFAVFTVSLSNISTSPVVFNPSLASGTALIGSDTAAASTLQYFNGATWLPVSGNVTIAAGASAIQLRIATTDDAISEANETFSLTATPVSGATTTPASATATIIDNDGTPQFSINDVTVNENAGTITFTVSLSNPAAATVTVDYNTTAGSASAADYAAGTSPLAGTLTFTPGVLTQTITLNIVEDGLAEATETFNVQLSNASAGAVIADNSGLGTIIDNDAAPTINAQTFSYTENQAVGAAVATVTASDDIAVSGYRFTATGTNTSADGFFQISNAGSITITAAGAAAGVNDFETAPNSTSYSVTALDAAGNSSSATITLNETDLDDTAPVIANQSFSYAENRTAGATIASVAATDNVAVSGYRFTATGTNTSADGFFQISNAGSITITAAGAAAGVNDFETAPNSTSYSVTALDAAGNSSSATITLNETDLDDTAPVIANQSFSYAENRTAGATIASVAATDNVAVSGYRFTATGTNTSADGFFQISNAGSITITAAGAAAGVNDFETAPNSTSYSVTALDAAGNSSSATITLNETDLDDMAPVIANQSFSYAENRTAGATIASVAATDNVAVSGYRFTATGTNTSADGFFQISNAGSITITAAGAAAGVNDFETAPNSTSYSVTALDAAGNSSSATITLNETDLDDTAPVIANQSFSYAENRTAGATIASVAATDNVAVSGYRFTATGTNTSADGFFQISNAGSITITAAGAAAGVNDFETAPNSTSYSVTALDAAGNSSSATITLNETDLDDTAPVIANQSFSYAENRTAGATIASVAATDNVAVSGYRFTATGTNTSADGFFQISNAGSITITAAGAAAGVNDFETAPNSTSYSVTALDAAGNSSSATITLNETDLDDTAPVIANQSFSYAENRTAGATIASVAATDNVAVSGYRFTATGTNTSADGFFQISNAGSITITAAGAAAGVNDFETAPNSTSYSVTALDAAGNSSSATITLNETDLDDTAPVIANQSFSYAENRTAGATIASVAATDNVAVSGYRFTATGTNTSADGFFQISNAGSITITAAGAAAGVNDFETAPNSTSYSVTALDAAGNSSSATITLNETDLDDTAPVIANQSFSYAENRTAGATIASVAATDNVAVSGYRFTATGTNTSADGFFQISNAGSITITAAGAAAGVNDFETAPNSTSYSVTALDAAGNSSSATITLNETDLDDTAPVIANQSFSYAENRTAGATIASVAATDNVAVSGYRFTATGTNTSADGFFQISNAGSITITAAGAAAGVNDFETAPNSTSYSVTALDAAGNSSSATITLNETDLDDTAPVIANQSFSYAENRTAGATIASVAATDNVAVSGYRFTATGTNTSADGFFQISNAGSITITAAGAAAGVNDFETAPNSTSYSVTALDAAGNSSSATITLNETDLDDTAPVIANQSFSYAENRTAGATIASVAATDNVAVSGYRFTATGTNTSADGFFQISNAGSITITAAGAAAGVNDFETAPNSTSYSVTALDAAGNSSSATITLNETDLDDTAPVIANQSFSYAENRTAGATIASVAATDNVAVSGYRFTATGTNTSADGFFQISNAGSITITAAGAAAGVNDFETAPNSTSYSVTALDAAGNSSSATITLNETDLDDTAPVIANQSFSYAENRTAGATIASVAATDNVAVSGYRFTATGTNTSADGFFQISNAGSITITAAGAAAGVNDFETAPNSTSYSVTALDAAGNSSSATITLNETDLDDTAPVIANQSFSYAENRTAGATIASVAATDNVAVSGYRFTATGTNTSADGFFQISNAGSITITAAGAAAGVNDFETAPNSTSYSVTALDAAGNSSSATITLNETDLDDTAPVIANQSFSYAENRTAGATIASVAATDNVAVSGYRFTATGTNTSADGFFQISNAGSITITAAGAAAGVNDFETAPNSTSYSVTALDAAGNSSSATITLNETDLDDTAPVIANQSFSYAENRTAGATIASVAATDNVAVSGYRFTATGTNTSADGFFQISNAGSITITAAGAAAGVNDFETAPNSTSYSVTALDAAGNSSSATITLNETDLDDTAPVIANQSFSYAENRTAGATIASVAATDNVAVSGYRFTATGTNTSADGFFQISNAGSITITAAGAAAGVNDFETAPNSTSYSVTALDAAGNSSSATITLNETDLDDTAPVIANQSFSYAENRTAGATIASVAATDNVAVSGYRFTATGTNTSADGFFQISNAGSITITAAGAAAGVNDFETAPNSTSYSVTALDAAGNSSSATITLNETDLDDTAPVIANQSFSYAENRTAGATIASVAATDNVAVSGYRFTATGTNTSADGFFQISNAGSITITAAGAAAGVNDFETAPNSTSYSVTALDAAGNSSSATITLNETDLDDTAPVIANQSFSYAENRTAGATIASVAATDNVAVSGYRFTATGTNTSADGFFQISNAGSITITAAGAAAGVNDFETAPNSTSYSVTALDAAGNSSSATITLNETDLDDTAPVIANQSFSYAENRTAGATIASVAATDNVAVSGYRFTATGTNTSADGFFQISNAGSITITAAGAAAGVNDFETAPNSTSYSVTALDAAGNSSSATITLNETDLDDTAPVIANQSFSYAENRTAGATIASVAATDNVAVSGYRFTATGTNTSADGFFQISNAGSITITAAGAAAGVNDFETAPNSTSYSVTALDAAGNSSSATITLNETDLDDTAPVIANQSFSYAENRTAGATIASVAATDNVAVSGYRFTATGTNTSADGFFQISNAGSITITAAGAAAGVNDFETAPNSTSYSVTALDAAGNSSSATITLNETNVNEGPVANADTAAVSESGVNPGNTAFAGVPAATGNILTNDTDVDAGDTKTVTAVNGVAGNVGSTLTGIYGTLSIAANGSYTYTLNNADPDTQALAQGQAVSEVFTYTMRDTAGLTSSSNLTVNITGTNDAPVLDLDANNNSAVTVYGGNANGGAGFNGGDGGSVNTVNFNLGANQLPNSALATVVLTSVDSALAISVNGTSVHSSTSLQLENSGLLAGQVYLRFADGGFMTNPYQAGSAPRVTVELTETGVRFFGTRAIGGTVYEELFPDSGTFTLPDFVTGANSISITNPDNSGPDSISGVINVTANNASATGYSATYVENAAGTPIADTDVAISDVDNTNIASATVTLTNAKAGDVLAALSALPAGITASAYNSGTGVITLSGTATLAQYQNAIRLIGFSNTTDNPDTTPRTINVVVNDGSANSNTAVTTVNVVAINDAPVNSLPANYTASEDNPLKLSGLSVTDADVTTGNITVTLSVTSGTLTAANAGGVTVANSGTGSITLTGTLASINTYLATAANQPTYTQAVADFNGAVTLTMTTNDGGNTGTGGALTDTDTRTITISPVGDIAADTAFTSKNSPVTINVNANDTFENSGHTITAVNGTAITDGGAAVAVTNGSVQLVAGNLVFSPASGYAGTVPNFTYTVTSGGVTETANVSVTVVGVNSVTAATQAEGTSLVHTVTLSAASTTPLTLAYNLAGITATAGSDFSTTPTFSNGVTLTGGVLNIPAGISSFTVTVPTINDTTFEPTETYNLTVGDVTAAGTITDNDAQPSITINDVSAYENAGTMTFTVTLSNPSYQTVTVNYATAGVAGAFGATSGTDFTAASGTLTFLPGEISKTITVTITNDASNENNETFNVNLTGATNATIADNQGVGTILNDDATVRATIDLDANNSSGATGNNFTRGYTENAAGVSIADTDVTISDADSTNMVSATITLTNPYAGDVLAFGSMPAGITASISGNVVTLTGSATKASYQTAIQAVNYSSTSDSPYTGVARTITVTVNDGIGNSNTATTTINVTAVNDAPVLDLDANNSSGATGANYATTFSTVTSNPVAIADSDISITDPDNTALTGATITLSATNRQTGDVLIAGTLPAGITASAYNSTTGVLTLTGSATLAQYQTAIRAISFDANTTSTLARTVTVVVTDGITSSNTATTTITPVAVNAAPMLDLDASASGTGYASYFSTVTGTPISVADTDISITDIDSTLINAVAVSIANAQAGDFLNFTGSAGGLTVSYGSSNGIANASVVITGNGTLAQYQAIIQSIVFDNNDANPSALARTVNILVRDDGNVVSNTAVNTITFNNPPDAKDDAPIVKLFEDTGTTTLTGNAITGGAGNVADTDTDGNTIQVTDLAAGTTAPTGTDALGSPITVNGIYGTLQIAANGSYTYILDNTLGTTQNLQNGQTANDVFTYRVTDGNGGYDTATISVQVGGSYDFTAHAPFLQTVATTGLSGEYYGYNESTVAGNRVHFDDRTATTLGTGANLESVEDITAIINGRNAAVGGSGNIVGTNQGASLNAMDASFYVKTLNYGISPLVAGSLGSNEAVAAGNSLLPEDGNTNSSTRSLSNFLDQDLGSAVAQSGVATGTTAGINTGLGKTTDAIIRMDGFVYLERGNYDFRVYADDGFRLKIGGETLLEFDGNQPPTTRTYYNVEISEAISGLTSVELLYWEQGGNANLKFEFKPSSSSTWADFSLDTVALFSNGTQPALTDTRIQDIVETATNQVYQVRTGSVIDGDDVTNTLIGNEARDYIQGNGGDDTLYGFGGADYLDGGSGNDTLYGGDGNDILEGGTGNDTLIGGLGDDIYRIDSAGDVITENAGEGIDTVEISASYNPGTYTLSANLENVLLNGSANINVIGNASANRITGNDGANNLNGMDGDDRLLGGKGNDTLTGGTGSDIFEWNLTDKGTAGSPAIDTVTDFAYSSGKTDSLDLRDLLVGEASTEIVTGGTPNIGNLLNYIDFNINGSNTEIRISSTGGFSGGTYSAGAEDQRIVLQGVNLYTATGATAGNETQLLQELLKNGTLVVD